MWPRDRAVGWLRAPILLELLALVLGLPVAQGCPYRAAPVSATWER